MESGKFDEELARMNRIAESMGPSALILFNESFAATNEREGAEIAGQIVRALLEAGVKVLFVTHQYTFASGFAKAERDDVILLKAERRGDGSRSFRVVPGRPEPTSHGEDLYYAIFREEKAPVPAGS